MNNYPRWVLYCHFKRYRILIDFKEHCFNINPTFVFACRSLTNLVWSTVDEGIPANTNSTDWMIDDFSSFLKYRRRFVFLFLSHMVSWNSSFCLIVLISFVQYRVSHVPGAIGTYPFLIFSTYLLLKSSIWMNSSYILLLNFFRDTISTFAFVLCTLATYLFQNTKLTRFYFSVWWPTFTFTFMDPPF